MNLIKFKFIFLLVFSFYFSFASKDSDVKLTKTATPVPFGKLTYVVGHGYDEKDPNIRMLRIPDGEIGLPVNKHEKIIGLINGLKAKEAKVIQRYENIFTIALPEEEFGLAVLFDDQSSKEEAPLFINEPELEWLSSKQAESGDIVRAMGKNLVPISLYPERDANGLPVSHAGYIDNNSTVLLKGENNDYIKATVIKGSSYDLHFKIPETIDHGFYEVFVHNGLGGELGWSKSQTLEIREKDLWPTKVFNVKDYGAIGDGTTDDTEAIEKALVEVKKNGGGVIYFPAGGYHFNATLRVPDKTIMKGESKERSWLYMPDGFHTNAEDDKVEIGIAGEGSIGLEDLSIHAVYVKMLLVAPVGEKMPDSWLDFSSLHSEDNIITRKANGSFIKNCRLLQNYTHLYNRREDNPKEDYFESRFNVVVLIRGDAVNITETEIIGKQSCLYLADSKYSKIANNTMYSGYGGNNIALQHGVTGYEKIIIEDNYLSAFSPFHHGSVWMMHGGRYISMFRNEVNMKTWVSDNEGLLGHMWGYRIPFFVEKATEEYVEIDMERWEAYWSKMQENAPHLMQYTPFNKKDKDQNDFSIYVGHELQVFRGTGLGEVNKVSKVEDNKVYFEEPFRTQLDESSFLVVHDAPAFRYLVFADNKIEDTGQAIFLWGHSHESIIDGNVTKRTGPIGPWTVFHAYSVAGGCHFFQMINNSMDEGRYYSPGAHAPGGRYAQGGIGAHYSCENEWASSGGALNSVGYIVRNNYFKNDNTVNYGGYDYTWCSDKLNSAEDKKDNPKDMMGLIFEGNSFKNCRYGMVFGSTVNAVTKDNVFKNVETPIFGEQYDGILSFDNFIELVRNK